MSTEVIKKLRMLKDQLNILEAKEHEILDQIDKAISELEESNED
jgi:uncharacterized membrane protein